MSFETSTGENIHGHLMLAEHRTTPEPDHSAELAHLSNLAMQRGITDPTRINDLLALATNRILYRESDASEPQDFSCDGLYISKPHAGTPSVSSIDFTPPTREHITGAQVPQRAEASHVMLTGLQAIQNYLLLIDAHIIDAPDFLAGTTNAAMAKVAKRVGFKEDAVQSSGIDVSAKLDDVRQRVFSPEMARIEVVLEERLDKLRHVAGQAALANQAEAASDFAFGTAI